jgi:hypothetical protein
LTDIEKDCNQAKTLSMKDASKDIVEQQKGFVGGEFRLGNPYHHAYTASHVLNNFIKNIQKLN